MARSDTLAHVKRDDTSPGHAARGSTVLKKVFVLVLASVLHACADRNPDDKKAEMLIRHALGETPKACSENRGDKVESGVVSKDELGTINWISLTSCGKLIHAYEAIPSKLSHDTPVVIALHQTTSHGKDEVLGFAGNKDFAYGRFFLKEGFIVVAPDVFVAGENYREELDWDTSEFYAEYPEWSAMGRMLQDNVSVVSYSREAHRFRCVAVVGHSLGGHNALFLGAFDDRIDIVVASAGFELISTDENATRWARDHGFVYMPRMRSLLEVPPPREVPWDFDDVIRLILPRKVLVIQGTNDRAWTRPESVASAISSASDDRTDSLHTILHSAGHHFGSDLQKETAEFIRSECSARSRLQVFFKKCCDWRGTHAR
jgi:dienelactone hydrolase